MESGKRWLRFTGAFELDEGLPLPKIGETVFAEVEATVTGIHEDRVGPEGKKRLEHTAVMILDSVEVTDVQEAPPPDPELPFEGEDQESETVLAE